MSRFCKLTDNSGTYGLPIVRATQHDESVVIDGHTYRLSELTEAQRQSIGWASWTDRGVDTVAYHEGASLDVLTATGVERTYPNKTLKTGADVDGFRREMKDNIDRAAEACRQQFITVGYGQAMSYQEKAAEAKDCLAAHDAQNPPPAGKYLLLESEVGVMGADVLAIAATVDATRAAWRVLEKQINTLRVTAKRDIGLADDVLAIRSIIAAIQWPLPS